MKFYHFWPNVMLRQLCVWSINASFAQKMQSLKRGELHHILQTAFYLFWGLRWLLSMSQSIGQFITALYISRSKLGSRSGLSKTLCRLATGLCVPLQHVDIWVVPILYDIAKINQCHRVQVLPKYLHVGEGRKALQPAYISFYLGQINMKFSSQHIKRRKELTYTL